MNIAAILLIASLSTLPPCPTEPVWDTANPCYAPGFCAVIPGQVLSWEHNPVDTTHFRACNEIAPRRRARHDVSPTHLNQPVVLLGIIGGWRRRETL